MEHKSAGGCTAKALMNSKVKVIFFDVGNTLLFPNRERIHAPLVKRGFAPNGEHLRDLECRTKNQFDACLADRSVRQCKALLATFRRKNALSEIGPVTFHTTDAVSRDDFARVHSRARALRTALA